MNLNHYLRPIQHSETLLINERSASLAQTRPIHRFGFGQSPFPVPDALQAALREHAGEKAYLPVQGLPALRQAVAQFHRTQDGVDWQPERTLIGPGSKLLIFAVMAAFTRAEVLLISPSWVSYEPQAHLAGHPVHRLQTTAADHWRLSAAQLDAFCRSRTNPDVPLILVLNYPGNPSGTSYSADELGALAEVMRAHGVLVISDEIYGMLHHKGEHRSLAQWYPEGTLVTGGLSKWCGAGGWRLGVMHVPAALEDSLLPRLFGVASETWSCVAAPIQHAAIKAYEYGPDIQAFVQHQRTLLQEIGNTAADRLNKAGIDTAAPEGGFYLFPDFGRFRTQLAQRGINGSDTLCAALLEEAGVALLPGTAFGMLEEELVARLAYVNFDGKNPEPVYQGIQAIVDWVAKILE
ncbi:pyridoxal phosphate-dependent aminotransferase [Salinispirillum sp. LH 10-3-1]|uniref:Aminotransferase n=1 Tax=Salinispirillum sp. LH 10-3-1 TaxID=2952525 RepID=A0AB38YK72_9GAMM